MVARATDSEDNGGLRFAFDRMSTRVDKVEETAVIAERGIDRHMLECKAAYAEFRRDLQDVSKQIQTLTDLVWRMIYVACPVLLILFAVQILGIERAFNVFDSIRQVKSALP
jgi:hypothetical protein